MSFDEILNKVPEVDKDALMRAALKRQAYQRRYQARLRAAAKLLTLQKKIDANLDYVLGYIKSKYPKEYEDFVFTNPEIKIERCVPFDDWYTVFAQDHYTSIDDAHELSGLSQTIDFKTFSLHFKQRYVERDGVFVKKTIDNL